MPPLEVALIISTYQRPEHLQRSLLSVALQQGVAGVMEVVVTDDGSEDDTVRVVEDFARSVDFPVTITTHRHSSFQLARCRNEGVLASTAPYLLFLDGDLLIPPDFVAQHLAHRQHGVARVGESCWLTEQASQRLGEAEIRSGCFAHWLSSAERRRVFWKTWRAEAYSLFQWPDRPRLKGGNAAVWRCDFERINGYDQEYVGWGLEDSDLQRRLRLAGVRFLSSMRWTRTYHLWHPRDPSFVYRAHGTRNESLLSQQDRPWQCRSGLRQHGDFRGTHLRRNSLSGHKEEIVRHWKSGAGQDVPSTYLRIDQPSSPRLDSRADSLRDYFSRVVCINLRSRPDRWEAFCRQVEASDWPFLTPQRFRAVDGRVCRPPEWMQNRYAECVGAWGCYQSHLRILEDALLDEVDRLLILEDDAVFAPDFARRASEFLNQVPRDWDHLFLGGEHMLPPEPVNSQVVRGRRIHRTHAHALSGDYIRQAYDYLIAYPTIDHYRRRGMRGYWQRLRRILRRPKNLLGSSHAERSAHVDHHFGAMHRLGLYQVYAPRDWLVGQAAGFSTIMHSAVEETFYAKSERSPVRLSS